MTDFAVTWVVFLFLHFNSRGKIVISNNLKEKEKEIPLPPHRTTKTTAKKILSPEHKVPPTVTHTHRIYIYSYMQAPLPPYKHHIGAATRPWQATNSLQPRKIVGKHWPGFQNEASENHHTRWPCQWRWNTCPPWWTFLHDTSLSLSFQDPPLPPLSLFIYSCLKPHGMQVKTDRFGENDILG